MNTSELRHDWTRRRSRGAVRAALRGPDVPRAARRIARITRPNAVQMSTLLSIKTGACPEDCAYCPQTVRYDTGLERETLCRSTKSLARAGGEGRRRHALLHGRGVALAEGARRRSDRRDGPRSARARHGDLRDARHARRPRRRDELKDAGLDYYNHNLDTSPEFYGEIITTRTYQDRLDTLERVRDAGLKVCCGGIVGMGETARDRAGHAAHARQPAAAPGERADQPARAGAGHAARRHGGRSIRSSSCARSPSRAS